MRRKLTATAALLLGLGLMAVAALQLAAAWQVNAQASAAYQDLRSLVGREVVGEQAFIHMNEDLAGQTVVLVPEIGVDFAALRAVNEDAVAWLYLPGTLIDYPVMRASDYSYYLTHLPDRTPNGSGSLFIDYNTAWDFSGPLTIIYGHNMRATTMFGTLDGYKTQGFYDEHPYMYLYTEQGAFRLELKYGCVIAAGQWRDRAFMYAENREALLAYAAQHSTFASEVELCADDRVVALSTCSYEFDGARFVVIGVLRSAQPASLPSAGLPSAGLPPASLPSANPAAPLRRGRPAPRTAREPAQLVGLPPAARALTATNPLHAPGTQGFRPFLARIFVFRRPAGAKQRAHVFIHINTPRLPAVLNSGELHQHS